VSLNQRGRSVLLLYTKRSSFDLCIQTTRELADRRNKITIYHSVFNISFSCESGQLVQVREFCHRLIYVTVGPQFPITTGEPE
jgi:hypothetical protein